MLAKLRIAFAALVLAAAVPACLDVPDDDGELTSEEQDLDVLAPPTPPACDPVCYIETTSCAAACVANGVQTTCEAFSGGCTQLMEARKGRNPQTGETIQIPAKTTLKFR